MNFSNGTDSGEIIIFTTSSFYTSAINNTDLIQFKQSGINQAASFLIFLLTSILFPLITTHWLWRFYHRSEMKIYRRAIKMRQLQLTLISYPILFIFIFLNSVATIYLYFDDNTQQIKEGQSPIIYSKGADAAFHYLLWFSFWTFVQIKVYKLCNFMQYFLQILMF